MYKLEQKLIHGQLVNVKVYPARYIPHTTRWTTSLPPLPVDTESHVVDYNTDGTPLAVDKALRAFKGGKLSCY